jgi:hypothetical protein
MLDIDGLSNHLFRSGVLFLKFGIECMSQARFPLAIPLKYSRIYPYLFFCPNIFCTSLYFSSLARDSSLFPEKGSVKLKVKILQ